MANHLIIGLGGTGGKILCGLRKRIYAETKKKDITGETNLEYLYVDSSLEDLNNTEDWKYMGKPLHLGASQKVCINGISATVMSTPHAFPGIAAFLSDRDLELLKNDQVQSIISTGIGGQRRRFGRMLIANNISMRDQQNSFDSRLQRLVEKMTNQGNAAVDIHVCAGLAGGTGSGSIVDVIAQVQKIIAPMGANFRLFLYLYIPEILVPQRHNAGFYHANGFAALMELNALSLNQYHPTDVSGNLDYQTQKVARLLKNSDAFNKAYLFSNFNEENKVLPKSGKLTDAVADFIYQRTIVPGQLGENGVMARLMSAENNGNAPEKDEAGVNVHSREFVTFGTKRIEYPEQEIVEYVSLEYTKQATLQMAFNTWADGHGFETCSSDEIGLGYRASFTTTDQGELETLKISDRHVTLQTAIKDIKGVTDNWQDYYSYWENITKFFGTDAMQGKQKYWFDTFNESCEIEWNRNFRTGGVPHFFEQQQAENNGYAAFIRRHIETRLFNDWLAGTKSLLEVIKYVQLLILVNEERIQQFDNRIADTNNYMKTTTLVDIEAINNEWNNQGIFTSARKIFNKYQSAKCELYTEKTEIESFKYAKSLLMKINEQLGTLLTSITEFNTALDKVLKGVVIAAENKCKIKLAVAEEAEVLFKMYNPEEIRKIAKILTINKEKQKLCAKDVRERVANPLGDDKRTFAALKNSLGNYDEMASSILDICEEHVKTDIRDWETKNEGKKILNVSILDKIQEECPTDEALEKYVKDQIERAKCFMQFDAAEMGKVIAGQAALGMTRMVQLCLPANSGDSQFRQKFINMFAQQCPGFNPATDVALNDKSNQMVIVSASFSMPLRYINNLKYLEEKYKELTHGPQAELNKVLLHTESFTNSLPELFEASNADKRVRLLPYSIILHSLGILEDKTDPETGATFKAFSTGSGFSRKWIRVGKQMEETTKLLVKNAVLAKSVTDFVDNLLTGEYKLNSKKATLRTAIENAVCDTILPLCGNNDIDPLFVEYRTAAEKLFADRLADK
ncbi:MAG: tubulin-like doman-containing protein [Parabacteroides sp.]|nr:tubulin-like doman-containing protein [Parabacteroides sp.]